MKLSKKDLKRIEKSAIKYKQFYETPNHEIDAIVQELIDSSKNMPKNMTKEEEISYILDGDNGDNNLDKLKQIIEEEEGNNAKSQRKRMTALFAVGR